MQASTKGKPVVGGEVDEEQLYIAPTVLTGVSPDEPVMQVCHSVLFFMAQFFHFLIPGGDFWAHLPNHYRGHQT